MEKKVVAKKMKEARIAAGYTQKQIADMMGISYQAISNYERGRNKIDTDTLTRLCKIYSISVTSILCENDVEFSSDVELPVNLTSLPPMVKLPLVGDIACGEPILAQQNIECYVEIPDNISADFCLRCKGNSMINARIFDGDIVFIRQQSDVDDGEIAAVQIDGIYDSEATLKRVYKIGDNRLELRPENPLYETMTFTGEELNDIRILGKAVYFLSAIK